jgi:parallel beta-helix repeat protein
MLYNNFYGGRALSIAIGIMMLALMLAGGAGAATLTVCSSSCTYSSIQAAINAANSGDTVIVNSGTYYENVNVNKQLTLRGIGMPVVNAGGSGSAITLAVNGIILEGFTATAGDTGITVGSNSNKLSGNNASNNGRGISLEQSGYNTLIGNIANSNRYEGFQMYISRNNTLIGNIANSNDKGIYLYYYSNYNTLIGNTANSNNEEGIGLFASNNNTLKGNNASKNKFGIFLHASFKNINNILYQNDLVENTNNSYDASSNHWRGGNDLCNCSIPNAYDERSNYWDDSTKGNHYSNFDEPSEGCTDTDGNSICDSSHHIPGGSDVDRYPLTALAIQNTHVELHEIDAYGVIIPSGGVGTFDYDNAGPTFSYNLNMRNLKPNTNYWLVLYANEYYSCDTNGCSWKFYRGESSSGLHPVSETAIKTDKKGDVKSQGLMNIVNTWQGVKGQVMIVPDGLAPNSIRTCISGPSMCPRVSVDVIWMSASSITVTSPNGGENWQAGTVQTIQWTHTGNPDPNVKIELLKGGVAKIIQSSISIGSGSYSWNIPNNQESGTDYKVRITSTTNPAYTDMSNENFAIVAKAEPMVPTISTVPATGKKYGSICATSTICNSDWNDYLLVGYLDRLYNGKITIQGDNLDKVTTVDAEPSSEYTVRSFTKTKTSLTLTVFANSYDTKPSPSVTITLNGNPSLTKIIKLIPGFNDYQLYGQCTWYAWHIARLQHNPPQPEIINYNSGIKMQASSSVVNIPKDGAIIMKPSKHR